MKLKTLIVTVLVLAVLSVIVFTLQRPAPPPSADARLGQPVVERATVEKAAKLQLTDQGKTVTLARQADGTWRVPSYFDLPADFSKLSGFVSSLTEAKLDRLVTSNAERISRLEFKDTRIELLDATDKPIWTLTIGKTPESGGGRFVRFGTEQKAYLASLNAWLDTDAKAWADPQLLNLKPEDIAKVEIPLLAGGSVTFSRTKKDEAWGASSTPAGQRVRADKISSLLNSLGNLRFTETTDPADAGAAVARANARSFKLMTFEGKTVTVALGRKPEEKRLKPPTADAKSGPAALGNATDLLKKDAEGTKAGTKTTEPAKPLEPEFETIPAGPVFVFLSHSDPGAPLNALMQKRAFQVADYVFTGLPQKKEELFEPLPAPTEAPKAAVPNVGANAAGANPGK